MSGFTPNLPDPPRDPWIERRVHELVQQQEIDTQLLAVAINEAIRRLQALSFPLGFPAPGYDEATALSQLQELLPVTRLDLWYETARDLAQRQA